MYPSQPSDSLPFPSHAFPPRDSTPFPLRASPSYSPAASAVNGLKLRRYPMAMVWCTVSVPRIYML